MQLKMLKEGRWYVSGKGVRLFKKDEIILSPGDVPETDGKYMIKSNWAEEDNVQKEEIEVEENKKDDKTLADHIEEINLDKKTSKKGKKKKKDK